MAKPIVPINDTTYEAEMLSGDKVEIGDKKAVDFKPHLKLNRWDGECFITVQPAGVTEEEVEVEVEPNKIKCKYKVKQGDFELELENEFYSLEPRTVIVKDKEGKDHRFPQNELGGFEFEIILAKKPAKNTIELDIETQRLKFYYQPPLHPDHPTWREDSDGYSHCPENVVGSYAVYHATRGSMHRGREDAEKYKCGQAFHIYRPKVRDAVGSEIWADLSFDEAKGKLTITIDDAWLASAIYPVIIDPEFGYHVIGGSSATGSDSILGVWDAPAGAGNADEIVAYTDEKDGVQGALYERTGRAKVDVTVAGAGEDWLGWHHIAFTVPPAIVVQDYIVCFNNFYSYDRYYNTLVGSGTGIGVMWGTPYGTWPDPLNGNYFEGDKNWSVYCEYTAAAVGWTGKVSGVTNPAKIMGVPVANIAKVKGVA